MGFAQRVYRRAGPSGGKLVDSLSFKKPPRITLPKSRFNPALPSIDKVADYATGLPSKKKLGDIGRIPKKSELVIQRHDAKKAGRHYDIRLKTPQGLVSWASRKGLPTGSAKTLAVRQPIHRSSYASFEGEIPDGYGAGTVKTHARGPATVSMKSDDVIKFNYDGKDYTMFRPKGKFKESDWLIKTAKIKDLLRLSNRSGVNYDRFKDFGGNIIQSKIEGLREKKAAYYHYVDPDVVPSVKEHGLMGMGYQLRKGTPEQQKKMKLHLERYERFLNKGERPTTENLLRAVQRARKHPQGADRIYLLQEKIDLSKGNDSLKKWMHGKVPIEVDVNALKRAKKLIAAEHLDADPVDYSKLGDKVVFKDIPHPNILVRGGKINPRYLKHE